MNEIVMDGVREYSEGYPVSIDIENGEVVIVAVNQGGDDCTKVNLKDVLNWLLKNSDPNFSIVAQEAFNNISEDIFLNGAPKETPRGFLP